MAVNLILHQSKCNFKYSNFKSLRLVWIAIFSSAKNFSSVKFSITTRKDTIFDFNLFWTFYLIFVDDQKGPKNMTCLLPLFLLYFLKNCSLYYVGNIDEVDHDNWIFLKKPPKKQQRNRKIQIKKWAQNGAEIGFI